MGIENKKVTEASIFSAILGQTLKNLHYVTGDPRQILNGFQIYSSRKLPKLGYRYIMSLELPIQNPKQVKVKYFSIDGGESRSNLSTKSGEDVTREINRLIAELDKIDKGDVRDGLRSALREYSLFGRSERVSRALGTTQDKRLSQLIKQRKQKRPLKTSKAALERKRHDNNDAYGEIDEDQ